jgi:hypothetical protein
MQGDEPMANWDLELPLLLVDFVLFDNQPLTQPCWSLSSRVAYQQEEHLPSRVGTVPVGHSLGELWWVATS